MSGVKFYIHYARPMDDEYDEPPVIECYGDGDKPKKSLAVTGCVYVYDLDNWDDKILKNERVWDGVE